MVEKIITVADSITVGELADKLNLPVSHLVGELFKNGIVATINQKIDFETASIIIDELGLSDEVKLEKKEVANGAYVRSKNEVSESAVTRPPIVAVMGHVDHGKTSLLDAILDTKAVDSESGGITQHISAYQVSRKGRSITLLDTPGHEAFASLRQHGAILTDVVIIVVAADDGVKPQTVEAIKFAKSANAKIVVAINKIDKPDADANRVKAQLASDSGLNPEEWGGDTVMVEVSAKTGQGIDSLLDMVLLVSDLEDLRADVDVPAAGLVIEAHLEVGRGPVVGLLVERGMLKPGHFLVAGLSYGKVRTLQNFKGESVKEAGPSFPATVTGFKDLPQFGDDFVVLKTEKEARRQVALTRLETERNAASSNVTSSDLLNLMSKKNESKEMNVIVKADVQGSLTSVIDNLKLIDTKGEISLRVISSGVGDLNESDVRLAADTGSRIYGFNVGMSPAVKRLASREKAQIHIHKVIYELLDEVRLQMSDMLEPEIVETEVGRLLVKGIFRITKDTAIIGGQVTKGKITKDVLARLEKTDNNAVLPEAVVVSVQKEKQESKEVFEGEMCGLSLKTNSKLDIKEGDKIEFFTREIVKRSL